MGRKTNPGLMRLGIIKDWSSKWFDKKNYVEFLREDTFIREHIEDKHKSSGVEKILIERGPNLVSVVIRTSRPGLVIGRSGSGIEELKREVSKISRNPVKIEVQEIRNPDAYATLVAKHVAYEIERRMPFRRVLKQSLERVIQNKDVDGVKIQVAGRLGGADMSRREWLSRGKLPLQTLRADIDFAKATARTTYGAIGVKVWLYRKGLTQFNANK
jgi:small subunit ribosomal protein S3